VGLERKNMNWFVREKSFHGELFLDEEKNMYKRMQLKSNSIWNGFGLFSAGVLARNEAAKKAGVTSPTLAGDGMQLGSTLVIAKGGAVLLRHDQKYYGDDPKLESILRSLGISEFDRDLIAKLDAERSATMAEENA